MRTFFYINTSHSFLSIASTLTYRLNNMKTATITLLLTLCSIFVLFCQAAPIEQSVDKYDSESNSSGDMHASDMPWGKRDTEWSSPADNHAARVNGDMIWGKRDTEWSSPEDRHHVAM
ncbi:MAG: hypothetical protein JOS17DRAFT_762571 [Linnemannia elongata]|nr:MAG: hypothetical protein JOS17DRAFT_762571 [Linnemannia elongata]